VSPGIESSQLPRDRLLLAAVAHAEKHGLSDLSLRELAAAIGTSHRMLIYHFGSKEGLVVEIVRAVEESERRFLHQLLEDPTITPAEAVRTMWGRLADPALRSQERLFFEIYGQALQGRPGTAGFLDDIVDSWVDVSAQWAERQGIPRAKARADARLGVAVMRGLLLDLLATGDRRKVDDALARYVELHERAGNR
jgi:AcrR family transcriptional regulator